MLSSVIFTILSCNSYNTTTLDPLILKYLPESSFSNYVTTENCQLRYENNVHPWASGYIKTTLHIDQQNILTTFYFDISSCKISGMSVEMMPDSLFRQSFSENIKAEITKTFQNIIDNAAYIDPKFAQACRASKAEFLE